MKPGERQEAVRLADVGAGELPTGLVEGRVCYWRSPAHWWVYLPGAGMGNLAGHDVEEHADGTITVRPSIAVGKPGRRWLRHGYLVRGVWREV